LVFALCNSSDAFLLLKIKQSGLADSATIGIYIFYNIVYALSAFPLGILADRIGLKKIFVSGLFLFTIVYAGMGFKGSLYYYGFLFFLYGLYAAATEGISKAWISNITNTSDTATAIGTYTGFQSICTMLASFITGWVWFKFGSSAAFWIPALGALTVLFYFLFYIAKPDFSYNTGRR
jgi:MFS family permease